jgi:hypothetical protein
MPNAQSSPSSLLEQYLSSIDAAGSAGERFRENDLLVEGTRGGMRWI